MEFLFRFMVGSFWFFSAIFWILLDMVGLLAVFANTCIAPLLPPHAQPRAYGIVMASLIIFYSSLYPMKYYRKNWN